MILYKKYRSARVKIQPADGPAITVNNMDGTGLRLAFTVKRTLSPKSDEGVVRIYNLGPDTLGRIETQPGDPGDPLTVTSFTDPTTIATFRVPGPESALEDGYSIITLEGGYEGSVSTLFESVSTRVRSQKGDGHTVITTLTGLDNIDGQLFGNSASTYRSGTPLFAVVDELRQQLGLSKGNFSFPAWTALAGTTKLSSPYTTNSQAFDHMNNVFAFLRSKDNAANIRWFQDLGEFFIYRDDGFVAGTPLRLPWIKNRPARESSGAISVSTYLAPRVRPGRLVLLEAGEPREGIPAGVYRCDSVSHVGDTDPNGVFTTTLELYPTRFAEAA